MEKDNNENVLKILKKSNEVHFCLLVLLYYHKNVNKLIDLDQIVGENPQKLFSDLPSGMTRFLKKYDSEYKLTLMIEGKLADILKQKYSYLNENIKSIFSLWKILFRNFADLSVSDFELFIEIFSELNILSLGELKNLLYVGENFNENLMHELLFILMQINNYQEIHIINYNEGNININKCLENIKDDLCYIDEDILEAMMKRVIIIEEAQLNFEYLYHYVDQNSNNKFIIINGIERLVKDSGNSIFDIKMQESGLNFHMSGNINWSLFLKEINKLYELLKGKNTYLLIAYFIDNILDDARQNLKQFYSDNMFFDILYDYTTHAFNGCSKDEKLNKELLNHILNDNNAYDKILANEKELSECDFIILKVYYFLFYNDYYHAMRELEKLPEDVDNYFKFLLAELYNITGETNLAYTILIDIYKTDKYFPNIISSIVYSLRYNDDKNRELLWIKKGLAMNPKDTTMVMCLANHYTGIEDFLESANQWKALYNLTNDIFYALLYEINLILSSANKKQIKNIDLWVSEKVSIYPQYKDEIYSRIGNIIYDKINKEEALSYLEKVTESYDESFCVSVVKIIEIYYKIYSRKIDRKVNLNDIQFFVQKLTDNVIILTYVSHSVYSWSDYIHKLFTYDKWVESSSLILLSCLLKLVKRYINGETKGSRFSVDEKHLNDFESSFDNYEDQIIPNLEVLNRDEYLLLLLIQAKIKISEGEIQLANDIAYTLFKLANTYEEHYYKNISMCFGLLIWSSSSMAIGAYAEGILSFVAAADRLLEINESVILHETEIVFEQFYYLYNRSFRADLDLSDLLLLENYFDKLNYPKILIYHILGRYEDIIKQEPKEFGNLINQMEEANIIILADKESLNTIICYDALISSYYEIGELDKARIYLRRLYPTINITLTKHIDSAHLFLMRYSNILMDLKDYDFSIEIFKSSLLFIEKLRGMSFSSERSYLGDSVDTIIRRIIYIICEKNNLTGDRLETDRLLAKLMINLVPKAIIEERNGNYAMVFDEILFSKEKEYYQLFDLLNNVKNKSIGNSFYKQIADQFFETKRYLEKNHPKFKHLQSYSLIDCNDDNIFAFLGSKLEEGEMFYRNILVEEYVVHILVKKGSYRIYSDKINLDELSEKLECLEIMINDSVHNLSNSDFSTYVYLFEKLTGILFKPLISQLDSIDSLYYMPDYKLLHITPNFIRINDKWGIECFNRIELVIDYNNIGKSEKRSNVFGNKFFVSESTKGGLQEIKKTVDKFPSFTKLAEDESGRIVIHEQINTLIVAAHGISKEFGELYHGAKKLELSRKKQINLNEFIELRASTIENAIIIACSGGTPTNDKIERNNGVWDSMLKKSVRNVLYCKWDVSTQHTNELLSIILQEMCLNKRSLSEALNLAQRKLMSLNPILWSGLEVWKNY